MTSGIVYLVGAGPGDPELITVKGLRVLRRADVVVYDRLVSLRLVDEAPPSAERICAWDGNGCRLLGQAELNRLLIDRARGGRMVVRLKGGDPFVFGRGGEEAEALRAAGIPYEVVPGVTSAVAVAAYAGIPLTHRRLSAAFAVTTGHRAGQGDEADWAALARIPTLVVLMALRSLPGVVQRLLEHGALPATPAAMISNGTTPLQRVVVGNLGSIVEQVSQAALESPATLVVGEVARLGASLAWFDPMGRPADSPGLPSVRPAGCLAGRPS